MIAFLTANSRYRRKESLSQCQAKVLVAAGEREQQGIKQSARDLEQTIPNAALDILPGISTGSSAWIMRTCM